MYIDFAKLIRSNEIDGWDEGKNLFCRGLDWDEFGMDAILCRWALYGCKEDIILFSDGSLLVFFFLWIEWKGGMSGARIERWCVWVWNGLYNSIKKGILQELVFKVYQQTIVSVRWEIRVFLLLKIDLKLGGFGQQVIVVRVSFRPSVKIVYCRGDKVYVK